MKAAGRWVSRMSRVGCLGWVLGLVGCAVVGGSDRTRSAADGGAVFVRAQRELDEVRVRLWEAVLIRDREAILSLLTPDFSWREDEIPLEETPFDFWERHRLWEALEWVVKAKTVRVGAYYVAPAEAKDPRFAGPKASWRRVGNDWRLAAFYPGARTERGGQGAKEPKPSLPEPQLGE